MRQTTKERILESFGYREQFNVWKTWTKKDEVKNTQIYISLNDLNTIKSERELRLILDELNR
jgi:membrane protein CcdC involved in cytochrome C biogenesis